MLAYLPDGRVLPYDVYITSDAWVKKKAERYELDHGTCCICHQQSKYMQGHHVSYEHLGNEDVEKDIMTLCSRCHRNFHNTWGTITGITSQQTPEHWKYYSADHTLQFFAEYLHEDMLLGGEYKMTSRPVARDFIDKYYIAHSLTIPARISLDDIVFFFRNRRLEKLIQGTVGAGRTYEEFLDTEYGKKGVSGAPNEKRSEANKQFKDMAEHDCIKARETLRSAQGRYIENLWDTYIIKERGIAHETCRCDV